MTSPVIQPQTAAQDDVLWRIAMEHVLALHAAPRDRHAATQAQQWRDANPRHAVLFAEAEKVWRVAGAVPPAHAARWKRGTMVSRRQVIAGGATALAAGIAGITLTPKVSHWLNGDLVTGTGEIERLSLADSGQITLGPHSIMRTLSTDAGYHVDLLQGLAFFDIPAAAERALTVRAGHVSVTGGNTSFELRHDDRDVRVAVARGSVTVSESDAPLQAGNWLAAARGQRADTGRADLRQLGHWRDGMLVVENQPVRDVTMEIGRWHRGRILLLDDQLAARPVSGVFDLTQPDAALRAMLQPFGGRMRSLTPWLTVLDVG